MLNFSTFIEDDVVIEVVNLKRATSNEAVEFRKKLQKDIEDGNRKIVVDLKYNLFMDSTFLGALVTTLKNISKLGGDLRIANIQGDTKTIFEFTGTTRVFKIYKSREDAIFSFKK